MASDEGFAMPMAVKKARNIDRDAANFRELAAARSLEKRGQAAVPRRMRCAHGAEIKLRAGTGEPPD